jgi:hypothetical protein
MQVSTFKRLKLNQVYSVVEVDKALEGIANSKQQHIDKVNKYRETLNQNVKYSLPLITWAGVFETRKNTNIVSFSDYMYLDIDNVKPNEAKEKLSKFDFIKAVWASVSNNGVGILVKSQDLNKSNFSSTYNAIKELIKEQTDYECDSLCDIARANFISHDKDIYVRETNRLNLFLPVEPTEKELTNYIQIIDATKEVSELNIKDIIQTNIEVNEIACIIAFKHAFNKTGLYIEGNRHNFSVSYAGTCNSLGVPLGYALNYIQIIRITNDSMNTIKRVYETYRSQFATRTFKIN